MQLCSVLIVCLRAGQSIHINYNPAEMPTFVLKSSTVSLGDTADVNMDATFNDDFDYFGGTMKFKSTGSVDRVYQGDCKVSHHEMDCYF